LHSVVVGALCVEIPASRSVKRRGGSSIATQYATLTVSLWRVRSRRTNQIPPLPGLPSVWLLPHAAENSGGKPASRASSWFVPPRRRAQGVAGLRSGGVRLRVCACCRSLVARDIPLIARQVRY
jgi:hypothetical protein